MTWVRKEQQVTKSHKVIKKGKGQKSTKGQRIPKDLKTTTRRKIKITGEAQKVGERKRKTTFYDDDDDDQPTDKVTGGERPLGEKLPDGFEVKDYEGDTHKLTGAIELHRLIFEDYDLEKRKDEMTSTLIDSTCTLDSDSGNFNFKEVSQPPLPPL